MRAQSVETRNVLINLVRRVDDFRPIIPVQTRKPLIEQAPAASSTTALVSLRTCLVFHGISKSIHNRPGLSVNSRNYPSMLNRRDFNGARSRRNAASYPVGGVAANAELQSCAEVAISMVREAPVH